MSLRVRCVITSCLIFCCPFVARATPAEARAVSEIAATSAAPVDDQESWIAVAINHAEVGEPVLVLRRKDGQVDYYDGE